MKANLNGRLARLEQQYSPQLMDPPEHMSIYVLAFGWESRCYIINQVGDFAATMPDFPDPFWRNVTAWLNQARRLEGMTALEFIERVMDHHNKNTLQEQ